jgi:UDP-glucose:(heptosyl)LPS alpha-1,3-glucosyltransferase
VILNGYDAPEIAPAREAEQRAALRQSWGLAPSETAVLFAGSGWERKGLRPALKALENTSGLRLIVAGKGPAARYQSPQVIHLGAVSDLSALFPGADFLLHPTLYDPFSNACLEALAAGLPVVTTVDNGFAELLVEGMTGSILPERWTPDDLTQRLQFWQNKVGPGNSGERVKRIREACRQAAEPWSVARNLEQTLAYLATING